MADYILVVSGLPRSGTSMMMRMLEAGGMPALTDKIRQANEDNPAGYYEYERVKKTKQDPSWVPGAMGKAVKMVYQLVYDLPPDYSYKVLCMRRRMEEILASQRAMLIRDGHDPDLVSDAQLSALFQKALTQFESWAQQQSHLELQNVSYNRVLEDPRSELGVVNDFLDGILDLEAMIAVVDQRLYRNRG